MKILMVLSSHARMGDTGKKTGFWLDEFTTPYYIFTDADVEVSLASPKGEQPPIDPTSTSNTAETESTKRFHKDEILQNKLTHTMKLEAIESQEYDALFYPGGHGCMWDLVNDLKSISLIEAFHLQRKPMAFICHAPAVLGNVDIQEEPMLRGKNVTGFSNSEENATGLTEIVPFLVEDKINQMGGNYSKGEDGKAYIMTDGKLVTGQNPASSALAAKELLKLLQK